MPNYDVKILIGHMNAKIVKEEKYRNVTTDKSKHEEINENEKVVIQFSEENNLWKTTK